MAFTYSKNNETRASKSGGVAPSWTWWDTLDLGEGPEPLSLNCYKMSEIIMSYLLLPLPAALPPGIAASGCRDSVAVNGPLPADSRDQRIEACPFLHLLRYCSLPYSKMIIS